MGHLVYDSSFSGEIEKSIGDWMRYWIHFKFICNVSMVGWHDVINMICDQYRRLKKTFTSDPSYDLDQ